MKKRDMEFFEEYKKLDCLLGDMLSCNKGVTSYIEQMENTYSNLKCKIPTWEKDYKDLKHLRWVRNRIAHDENSDIEEFSKKEDLIVLLDFYKRALNQKDPFSLLRKEIKKNSPKKLTTYRNQPTYKNKFHKKENKTHPFITIFASVILAIILMAVVIYLQK